MFRKLLGKTITTVTSKKSLPPQNTRSFSTSDVESWIKIYQEMQSEAGKIAENSIGNVKSEINSIRSEVNSVRSDFRTDITIVKSDIAAVKTDVAALKNDIAAVKTDLTNFKVDTYKQFNEVHKQLNEVHKQASSNVRIILAGMFGIGAATVTANQFIGAKLGAKHDDLASPTLSIKKP